MKRNKVRERIIIFIISMILTSLAVISGRMLWRGFNRPTSPTVVNLANVSIVIWGPRFNPLSYQKLELDRDRIIEYVTINPEDFRIEDTNIWKRTNNKGWQKIDRLPDYVERILLEGRAILEEHQEYYREEYGPPYNRRFVFYPFGCLERSVLFSLNFFI